MALKSASTPGRFTFPFLFLRKIFAPLSFTGCPQFSSSGETFNSRLTFIQVQDGCLAAFFPSSPFLHFLFIVSHASFFPIEQSGVFPFHPPIVRLCVSTSFPSILSATPSTPDFPFPSTLLLVPGFFIVHPSFSVCPSRLRSSHTRKRPIDSSHSHAEVAGVYLEVSSPTRTLKCCNSYKSSMLLCTCVSSLSAFCQVLCVRS